MSVKGGGGIGQNHRPLRECKFLLKFLKNNVSIFGNTRIYKIISEIFVRVSAKNLQVS